MLAVTVGMIRRGAFAPRVVVELRQDQRRGGRSRVTITAGGQPAAAEVRLTDADGERPLQGSTGELPELGTLRSVGVALPAGRARELKVWAHTISPDGISERLPVAVTVHDGDEHRDVDLGRSGGQIVLRLKHEACRLEFAFAAAPATIRTRSK